VTAGATAEDYAASAARTRIGDGETVVLMLHGLGGDRQQPLGLLPVVPAGLTVIAPDQRAHGGSPVIGEAEDFRVSQLADDAAALLRSEGVADRPLIVVGISMGAAVALQLLERGDHDIRGALLIRPAFGRTPWPEHLRIFREVAALLRSQGPDGVETVVSTPEYRRISEVSEAGATSVREQFTKPEAERRVVRLENVPANVSIIGDTPWTPPTPVTVVGAAGDPVHPLEIARLWHAHLHGSALIELPSRDEHPAQYQEASIDITYRSLVEWSH